MHERSRLLHSRRTFKVGVEGRKGVRLEPATLRSHGNDRSRTSIEIDRLRTSGMIRTTVETEKPGPERRGDARSTGCPVKLDEMTCSLGRVR